MTVLPTARRQIEQAAQELAARERRAARVLAAGSRRERVAVSALVLVSVAVIAVVIAEVAGVHHGRPPAAAAPGRSQSGRPRPKALGVANQMSEIASAHLSGIQRPMRNELIFAPRTHALLATETVLLGPSHTAGIGAGYPISWTAYVSSKAVSASAVPPITPPRCPIGGVALSLVDEFESATGEHDDLVVLTNRSGSACALRGYPHITLSHDGHPLHFAIRHGGFGYMPARKPRPVTITSGARAYFLVAKYRCDGRILSKATVLHASGIGLGGVGTLILTRPGVGELDFCRRYPGDRPIDPGNYLLVSPIEPTIRAAMAPPP